jgi:hypothetical protein
MERADDAPRFFALEAALWHGLPARENTAKMAVPPDRMVPARTQRKAAKRDFVEVFLESDRLFWYKVIGRFCAFCPPGNRIVMAL